MNNNQNFNDKSSSNIQDLLRPNNVVKTDNNDMALWNMQPQQPTTQETKKTVETQQPINQDITKQPKKKKKAPISTIIIALICLLTFSYGIYFSFFRTKTNTQRETNKVVEEESVKIDKDILLSWNGVYNADGKNIVIYMYDDYTINVDMKVRNSMYGFYALNENVTKDKITYEREEFGEVISITIEKTSNGIIVTSSSTDKKDSLNLAGGTYTKNQYTSNGWTGTYNNGDTTVILNEIDNNRVVTTITKESYVSNFQFDSATNTELNYLDIVDEGTIKITKTDTGINIEAQSKRDGDIFNEISGVYKKS